MGSISDYLEDELLDHVLGVGSFSVPSNIYIALSTTDPTDDGSGITEPSVGSYARVACNTWNAASEKRIKNTGIITFPQATDDWGTITHGAVFDAATNGNMLAHGALSVPLAVNNGDTFSIPAEEFEVYFGSDRISKYLANALLDHVFKVASYSVPSDIYVALTTALVTDAMNGSSITEPPSNYARINHNSWNTAASGASSNSGAITFVQATTVWGMVVGCALLDDLTSGNVLLFGALDTSKGLVIADQPYFPDGNLDVTLD